MLHSTAGTSECGILKTCSSHRNSVFYETCVAGRGNLCGSWSEQQNKVHHVSMNGTYYSNMHLMKRVQPEVQLSEKSQSVDYRMFFWRIWSPCKRKDEHFRRVLVYSRQSRKVGDSVLLLLQHCYIYTVQLAHWLSTFCVTKQAPHTHELTYKVKDLQWHQNVICLLRICTFEYSI